MGMTQISLEFIYSGWKIQVGKTAGCKCNKNLEEMKKKGPLAAAWTQDYSLKNCWRKLVGMEQGERTGMVRNERYFKNMIHWV